MDVTTLVEKYEDGSTKLLKKWKSRGKFKDEKRGVEIDHAGSVFISDGIIDPKRWFSQDVRPLFFLKEAYNGESDWDLVDYVLEGDGDRRMEGHTVWRKSTQWAYGIMNTTVDCFPSYGQMSEAVLDERARRIRFGNEHLRSIAVVNVKKSGGSSKSDYSELEAYADYDAEFIFDQIKMIDPTVIVCGYTSRYLRIALEAAGLKMREVSELAYAVEINGHTVVVLDYYHPSNQFPNLMNYYGLVGIYQQALKAISQEGR